MLTVALWAGCWLAYQTGSERNVWFNTYRTMAYAGSVMASTHRNNVVFQSPDPPDVHPHYASKSSNVLGAIQIATGALVLIISVIALATFGAIAIVGDLFCGVLVSRLMLLYWALYYM